MMKGKGGKIESQDGKYEKIVGREKGMEIIRIK